ncbi:MAG: hypothetical protein WA741_25990 [Candidatus Sulfotelmatobacter sp.]
MLDLPHKQNRKPEAIKRYLEFRLRQFKMLLDAVEDHVGEKYPPAPLRKHFEGGRLRGLRCLSQAGKRSIFTLTVLAQTRKSSCIPLMFIAGRH